MPRNILSQDKRDLYNENSDILKKETKEDARGKNDLECSWVGRIKTVKRVN